MRFRALNESQERLIRDAAAELPTQEQRQLFTQLVEQQVAVRTCDLIDSSSRAKRAVTAESEG